MVVQALLEDEANPKRRYLFVIDEAKALRAGIERVFGERAEVQHCQIYERQNVKRWRADNHAYFGLLQGWWKQKRNSAK